MNVVLAKTPYHILLAHAALMTEGILRGESVLIVLTDRQENVQHLINSPRWNSVHYFQFPTNRISRKSLNRVRDFVAEQNLTSVSCLMTCNDLNWRNQAFITSIQHSRFVLAEDGSAAYFGHQRGPIGWLYAEIYLRLFFSNFTFHYGKMNQSKADLGLSLHEGAFPWLPEMEKRLIFDPFCEYCKHLATAVDLANDPLPDAAALLMTQPLSDHGHWSLDAELASYQKLLKSISGPEPLVMIKRHPAESEWSFGRKLEMLTETNRELVLRPIRSNSPAEILCFLLPLGAKVLSIASTAALNVATARLDLDVICDSVWQNKLGSGWPISFV